MNNKEVSKNIRKMIYISLLVAMSLVLHIFENMIPVPFITPGTRLGLANIITVIALYTLSYKEAFLVLFLRILLSVMFGGSVSRLIYSLSGGILSYIFMVFTKYIGKEKVSIVGVSCAGAVFHNVGQLLAASLIVKTMSVMLYLPVMSVAGIGTGIFVGITSNFAVEHLKKIFGVNGQWF
ncbi:Gx transporter family protein [uncultured Clostridium sp.]|uniref:Gx transporter family protein n=1 Tax=uncultured Clostridium sp. TaxID=59620 RepID=UPI00321800AA